MTLEEAVASETAQLLMDADDARHLATGLPDKHMAADLLNRASALEHHAIKWEQRLHWWSLLKRPLTLAK
jgi:hypothetical protein